VAFFVEESMQITRAFSFVLLAMAAGACSSSSSKSEPVIDSFDVPSTVSASTVNTTSGTEQAYVLTGTLNFHDSAENVNSFTAHAINPANTVADSTVTFPNPPGPIANGPIQLQLAIPQGAPFTTGAKIDYQISITSVSGISSAPIPESVTLQ
jgi:hypothetical protein